MGRTRLACVAASSVLLVMAFAVDHAGAGEAGAPKASKAPPYRLNVYFPADFKDTEYQKAAFQQVLASWRPSGSPPAAGKKAVVIATIGKDGKLIGADFNLKSGSAAFDQAAFEAVKKASPFKPLPKGYARSSIEVHWHFEAGG